MKSKRNVVRRERREFSAEFKAEAVRLVAERRARGDTLVQVGRELDIKPDQLRAWAKQQQRDSGTGAERLVESVEQEVRRLRREVAVLRQEQAFAKKSGGVLREGVALRYAVITRHRGEFQVRLMCRVLEVAPSGYYASLKRSPSWHALIDETTRSGAIPRWDISVQRRTNISCGTQHNS